MIDSILNLLQFICGLMFLFWLPLIARFIFFKKPFNPIQAVLLLTFTDLFNFFLLGLGKSKNNNVIYSLIFWSIIVFFIIIKGFKNLLCPKCNEKQEPKANFCIYCGIKLIS